MDHILTSKEATATLPHAKTLSSVHKLAIIEEILKTGMVEVPASGAAWTLSNGARNLFGFTPDTTDIINNIASKIHPADRQMFRDDLVLMRSGTTPPSRNFRILGTNGLACAMHVDFKALTSDAGDLQKFVAIIRDVSDESDSKRAISVSSNRMNTLMNALGVECVFRIDSHGYLFDYMTRGTLKNEPNSIGHAWEDRIVEKTGNGTLEFIKHALSGDTPFSTQTGILCADGIIRQYNYTAYPVRDATGVIVEWNGTLLECPDGKINPTTPSVDVETGARLATGATIRALCCLVGWTHGDLSKQSQISSTTISRMTTATGRLSSSFKRKSVEAILTAFRNGGVQYSLTNDGQLAISYDSTYPLFRNDV